MKRTWIHTLLISGAVSAPLLVFGAALFQVNDTLSTSAPVTGANHIIRFQSPTGIGAGESILYSFPTTNASSGFSSSSIAVLGLEDFDFMVGATNQTVTSTASCSGAGTVRITTSTAASTSTITVEMCSSNSVSVNTTTTLRVGTNATAGGTGDSQITNPGAVGTYSIPIETRNSADVVIDSATAMIAIVEQISIRSHIPPAPMVVTVAPKGGSLIEREQSEVELRGLTSPGAEVVVMKEGIIVESVIARADGAFLASLKDIPSGTYLFTLYAIDKMNRVTFPITLNVSVPVYAKVTVENIILPPSFVLLKQEVESGEIVFGEGQTIPGVKIRVLINGIEIGETESDKEGRFQAQVSTTGLKPGEYSVKVQAEKNEIHTPESFETIFTMRSKEKGAPLTGGEEEEKKKKPQIGEKETSEEGEKERIPEEGEKPILETIKELPKKIQQAKKIDILKVGLLSLISTLLIYYLYRYRIYEKEDDEEQEENKKTQ